MRHLFKIFLLLLGGAGAVWAETPLWRNLSPGGGGWVQSVLWDRFDPNVLYVGSDVGGFYRSDDGGKSFRVGIDGMHEYFVETMAQSPVEKNTLFLGCCSGVYKSTNGGKNWVWKRNGFPPVSSGRWSVPISAIVFHPRDPEVVYAACGDPRNNRGEHRGKIFKSTDNGENWTQIVADGELPDACNISSLVIAPDLSMYLASDRGVYRSTDDGKTWRERNNGLPGHRHARRLAIAPSEPDRLYVTMRSMPGQPWEGGVYRSDDRGGKWHACTNGLLQRVGKTRETTSNFDQLAVDPRNANVVYLAGSSWVSAGVYKSTNGGKSWSRTVYTSGPRKNLDQGWIDFWGMTTECMALSPVNPEWILFGTDGHVCVSRNGAKTWTQIYYKKLPGQKYTGTGLNFTCPKKIIPHPTVKDLIYFGFYDIGLHRSADMGGSFDRPVKGIPMEHINVCHNVVFDPDRRNRMWAVFGQRYTGKLFVTENGARSWKMLEFGKNGLTDELPEALNLTVEKGMPVLWCFQKNSGVLRSADHGKSWRRLRQGLPEKRAIRTFLMSPADSGPMYCFYAGESGRVPACYRSDDRGQSWTHAGNLPCSDLKDAAMGANGALYLAARGHRVDARHAYSGGLFRSVDRGKTWNKVFADDRCVNAVAVDPEDPDCIVAGTTDYPYHDLCGGRGLFLSRDGGKSWKNINTSEFSHRRINTITFDPVVPRRLWVGSDGHSVYWTILDKTSKGGEK